MSTCHAFHEDLALHAGGEDLPATRERELSEHLEVCEKCQELARGLAADQALFAVASAGAPAVDAGLCDDVMRAIAESSPQPDAPGQPAPVLSRRTFASAREWLRRGWGSAAAVSAAAGILVVGLAVALAVGRLGPNATGTAAGQRSGTAAAAPGLAAPDGQGSGALETRAEAAHGGNGGRFLPVYVQRAPGQGIELSWKGDGREAAAGTTGTYHVLASDSPGSFDHAKTVEVAGSHLVATMDLPARSLGDRKVTFFRVQ